MTTKKCTKCGEVKSADSFHKRKDSKDKLAYECRACSQKRSSNWYIKNSDYMKQRMREIRQINPEIDRQRSRQWAAKNREIARQRAIKWAFDNPDRRKLQHHKRRALKRSNGVYLILNKELQKLKNASCVGCGSTKNLTIDHIIPLNRGGRHSVGNLQSLCGRCNSSKQDALMVEWRLRRSA
jgi:5-methylcytosine-specific restriction endonuclease McrA